MVTILNGISPFIQIPSLHQYVTSSNNQTDSNVRESVCYNPHGQSSPLPPHQIEPGLGLSETWYSVIVSAGSLGTFIGEWAGHESIDHTHIVIAISYVVLHVNLLFVNL